MPTYCFNYRIRLFQNLHIPKPENLQAVMSEELSSFSIIFWKVVRQMNETIGLHNKIAFMAVEVNDVRSDRVLPSEFFTQLFSISKMLPEHHFGVCLEMPQVSGMPKEYSCCLVMKWITQCL